jgi:hypothetical protein
VLAIRQLPAVAFLCGLSVAGCGGHDSRVSGVVTLDGQPLTTGTVTFHSLSAGVSAYGSIGAGGRFRLQTGQIAGLPPGEYVATVVATGEPPPVAPNESPRPGALLTPPVYGNQQTSPLKFTVKPGANHFKLELRGPSRASRGRSGFLAARVPLFGR